MSHRSYYFGTVVILALLGLAGCGESGPPAFHLDMRAIVANRIVPEHQREIADVLRAMFGTPDEPLAPPETGVDVRTLQMAAGPVWGDQQGDQHGLYRRHCAQCHGISGDGRGPSAMVLNPYPRDFRPAVFKFKSTYHGDRPTDQDLRTILQRGVPGTAMPGFALLPPDQIAALVEYVKYLSMRGQMESALVRYVADELDFDPIAGTTDEPLDPADNADQRDAIHSILVDDVVAGWKGAPEGIVVPEPGSLPGDDRSPGQIAQSVRRGRELFATTDCTTCHGPRGRGDGRQVSQDVWNMANRKFIEDTDALAARIHSLRASMRKRVGDESAGAGGELSGQIKELAARREVAATLLPPRYELPRDLGLGVYRGGQQPLDLFLRIDQGIPGTPMPGCGPVGPGAKGTLTENEIWQLVDYVRSLAHERITE
jgi:mono/diheme cytochrome c family protein